MTTASHRTTAGELTEDAARRARQADARRARHHAALDEHHAQVMQARALLPTLIASPAVFSLYTTTDKLPQLYGFARFVARLAFAVAEAVDDEAEDRIPTEEEEPPIEAPPLAVPADVATQGGADDIPF